jgi:hypothetical protein
MKKIITLILLFVSIISFGQKNEYKHAKILYKDKLYTEANAILDKILNKEYGILYKNDSPEHIALQGLFEKDCWDLKKECLLKTKDYQAAYISAEKYNALFREFVGSTESFDELASEELKYLKSLMEHGENQVAVSIVDAKSNNDTSDKKDNIETKEAETTPSISDNKTTSEPNSTTKTDNTETKVAETNKPVSDDKTVTLTVSGTGKTLEEAKLNALRSAIEQAFGAFISSKTEILNDNLVKDEIVSVASGNVQNFDVVSQIEVPNTGYAISLSATVSISKLTTFAESKGVVVEFKGGMFATNLKLQKLNEKNELKTITNIFGIMHEGMQSSYDYQLKTGEPVLDDDLNSYFGIDIFVTILKNNNYEKLKSFLTKSLSDLSMKSNEINAYNKLNKPIYVLDVSGYDKFYLRNEYSLKIISSLFKNENYYSSNFEVSDGIGNIFYGPAFNKNIDYSGMINSIPSGIDNVKVKKIPFLINEESYLNGEKIPVGNIENGVAILKWKLFYKQDELEKITSFDVKSSGIISKFKYGGFVIYEDINNAIVCSPYVVNLEKFSTEENNSAVEVNETLTTSSELFSAKQNTVIISKSDKNNIAGRLLEFNKQNSTDWYIPSKKEVILICENLFTYNLPSRSFYEYGYASSSYNTFVSSTYDMKYGRPVGYVVSIRSGELKSSIIKDVFVNKPSKWQYLNFKKFKFNDFDGYFLNKERIDYEYVLPISYIKLN